MRIILVFLFFVLHFSFIKGQQTVGLFQNNETASDDYTLFGNNQTIYLIDQCGFVVNTWESGFEPGLSSYLLKNGNLLRTAKIDGFFNEEEPSSRFELFDWSGEMIEYIEFKEVNIQAHHDIEPLPNGNFLAIVWEKISEEEAQENGRQYLGEVWSEKIIELEFTANQQTSIIWEWRLWDHLIQDYDSTKSNFGNVSEHPELMDLNFIGEGQSTSGDWIHLNAISYHPDLDQIALSARHISEIWIIDHSTTTEEARTSFGGNSNKGGNLLYRYGNPQTYQRGTINDQHFFKQHDIRWVPEGHPFENALMVFNNLAGDSMSSVNVWTPPLNSTGTYDLPDSETFGPNQMDWIYSDPDFYSKNISGAHFLTNGNLFVTEGRSGRFFEVTLEKEKVWEYINPSTTNGPPIIQGEAPRFNNVFRASKYPNNYEGFADVNLTKGNPIERIPWEINCDTSIIIQGPEDGFDITIMGNPVYDVLTFDALFKNQNVKMTLIDFVGKKILNRIIEKGINNISIPDLPVGVYLLHFQNNQKNYRTFKILKL